MSVLLDHYRSVQGMAIPNKGSGTTSQPTSVGFSGYVNATSPSESYGLGDEYKKGVSSGKSTATGSRPNGSYSDTSYASNIPSALNNTTDYIKFGVSALGASSALLKAAGAYYNNQSVREAAGTLGKVATGAGAALDIYNISRGQGGASPYVGLATKVGSQIANYAAQSSNEIARTIGGTVGKALPSVVGIYNIATGKGQGGDYLSVGGAAASTAGSLTGSAALSGIGSAISSYVAPYYALAKLGGVAINSITAKNEQLRETPFGRLGESLEEPFAVEQYWAKEAAQHGIGNERVNDALATMANPIGDLALNLNKGNWKALSKDLIQRGLAGDPITGAIVGGITKLLGKHKPAQTPAQLMAAYKWAQENPELNKKMVDEILAKQKWQEMIKINPYI